MGAIRLTKAVIQQILDNNEGYTDTTSYSSKNFSETNKYTIENGKLWKESKGKTSWADSKYDNKITCDIDQTRRFLRERLDDFDI